MIVKGKHKDGWVCDWMPVKALIDYDRLDMTHKLLYGKCSDNLQDKFTKMSQISSYSTRYKRTLHLPTLRLEFTKNSFQFTGVLTWKRDPRTT